MSIGAYDIFAFVIKILGVDWELKHIAIGPFETFETLEHG